MVKFSTLLKEKGVSPLVWFLGKAKLYLVKRTHQLSIDIILNDISFYCIGWEEGLLGMCVG